MAGLLATLIITTFFLSTVLFEWFGSNEAVARLRSLIVLLGLFVPVPAKTENSRDRLRAASGRARSDASMSYGLPCPDSNVRL